MRKPEQGRYIATYIRFGKVLDLDAMSKAFLIAHPFHGLENQQVRVFGLPFWLELIVVAIHDRLTSARASGKPSRASER